MNRSVHAALSLTRVAATTAALLLATGCGSAVPTTASTASDVEAVEAVGRAVATSGTTTTLDDPADATETADRVVDDDVLRLVLSVHVERHDTETTDRTAFDEHVELLDRFVELADRYGVVVTFEVSTPFVTAVDRWGSTILEDWFAAGHDVAQHSGDRSTSGLTGEARVAELAQQRAAIEAHGIPVVSVSGACANEPGWIEAIVDAGFMATSGLTEWCLASLTDEALPDGMEWIRDCTNPAICHDPLDIGTARVLHPWTTSSSTDFLTDDPAGGLVIVAGDDSLGFSSMSVEGAADAGSLDAWVSMLDTYVAAAADGRLSVLNTTLSIGPEPDWAIVEAMFAEAARRQDTGELRWTRMRDVVVEALLETGLPADASVVYGDVTPDLGGRRRRSTRRWIRRPAGGRCAPARHRRQRTNPSARWHPAGPVDVRRLTLVTVVERHGRSACRS